MRLRSGPWVLPALCALLVSCGDSPELIEKSKKLDVDIAQVEEKLAEVREGLSGEVADVGAGYDQAQEELAKLKSEAAQLESELVQLRDEKESVESRFSSYRKTHPIN